METFVVMNPHTLSRSNIQKTLEKILHCHDTDTFLCLIDLGAKVSSCFALCRNAAVVGHTLLHHATLVFKNIKILLAISWHYIHAKREAGGGLGGNMEFKGTVGNGEAEENFLFHSGTMFEFMLMHVLGEMYRLLGEEEKSRNCGDYKDCPGTQDGTMPQSWFFPGWFSFIVFGPYSERGKICLALFPSRIFQKAQRMDVKA